jgi:hypothetical protein
MQLAERIAACRREWVCGHLDYQRAVDALQMAQQKASEAASSHTAAGALQAVERELAEAQFRIAELAIVLAERFDRFCGVAR